MGRKNKTIDRPIAPDSKYHSPVISKFVARMMIDGKKATSMRIIYDAMDKIKEKTEKEPLEVFLKALDNVKPMVEVKSRRVGGATYQVPVEVLPERAQVLAIRWILSYSRSKKGIPMSERLARELVDAYKGEGASMKKREDTHKMAEANRAFAHYRW